MKIIYLNEELKNTNSLQILSKNTLRISLPVPMTLNPLEKKTIFLGFDLDLAADYTYIFKPNPEIMDKTQILVAGLVKDCHKGLGFVLKDLNFQSLFDKTPQIRVKTMLSREDWIGDIVVVKIEDFS